MPLDHIPHRDRREEDPLKDIRQFLVEKAEIYLGRRLDDRDLAVIERGLTDLLMKKLNER